MSVFATAAALLVLGTLLMLVPPLWQPSAAARRATGGVVLAVPLVAVGGYAWLGTPQALRSLAAPPRHEAAGHAVTPDQLQQRAVALAERLAAQPDDPGGWAMLGRSYALLGRYADAVMALRRAVAQAPAEPALLADLADLVAMTQGKRLAGEPAQLVQRALDADPRHLKALALAGSVAFETQDYAAARGYWERAAAVAPAGTGAARTLAANIAEARRLEGAGPAPAAATADAPALRGEVQLAPALAARVPPGAVLMVYARAAEGPRMPLAVQRGPAGAWPAPFRLDDRMAMAPGRLLSAQPRVVVVARLSATGDARLQPGDLVGESAPVAPGAGGLVVTIDRVQP